MEDEEQQRLSLRLYDVLEGVGASEEMRQLHRRNILAEIIMSFDSSLKTGKTMSIYHFGSFTEGTTAPGIDSDIDCLICDNITPIHADIRSSPDGLSYLLVQDDQGHPGYVKLQCVINRQPVYYIPPYENYMVDGCGRVCVKNNIFLSDEGERHGPAVTKHALDGTPFDMVASLRCSTVPKFAKNWARRCQRNGWPPQELIDKMSRMSYFVVGVGHESSSVSHLEFRLSFSLQERELMFHLNPVQHKCYILMKMIKQDIIQPVVGEGILSSYHCKTILFHVIENNSRDIWRPDNLIYCLMLCFLYLYCAVDAAFCPLYFLYEANLFDRAAFRRHRQTLLQVIETIIKQNSQILLHIKCSDVGKIFRHQRIFPSVFDPINLSKRILYVFTATATNSFYEYICRLFCRQNNLFSGVSTIYNMLRGISKIKRMIDHSEQQTTEAVSMIKLQIHHKLAISLAACAVESRDDEKKDRPIRLFEGHFQHVYNVDVLSSTLLYVTLMYSLGEYELCKDLLEDKERTLTMKHLLSKCICYGKPSYVKCESLSRIGMNIESQQHFQSTYMITCLKFMPSEHAIVHPALKLEMVRSKQTPPGSRDEEKDYWFDWAVVDGKVYFYFLQYLVYSKLNKPAHKQIAMDNLKWLIGYDENLKHAETAYNLLGWMYKEENRVEEALMCWEQSWEIRPYHNAAKWHRQLLIANRQMSL